MSMLKLRNTKLKAVRRFFPRSKVRANFPFVDMLNRYLVAGIDTEITQLIRVQKNEVTNDPDRLGRQVNPRSRTGPAAAEFLRRTDVDPGLLAERIDVPPTLKA